MKKKTGDFYRGIFGTTFKWNYGAILGEIYRRFHKILSGRNSEEILRRICKMVP